MQTIALMKKVSVLLIVIFGLLLTQSNAFACGNSSGSSTEKHSCEKEVSSTNTKEKSCCENNKDDKGCKGKCGNSNCTTTSSVSFSLFLYNEIEFTNNNFDFDISKSKFYHAENVLSDGFSSIWLIPKIS